MKGGTAGVVTWVTHDTSPLGASFDRLSERFAAEPFHAHVVHRATLGTTDHMYFGEGVGSGFLPGGWHFGEGSNYLSLELAP